jgi:hypothetical protein
MMNPDVFSFRRKRHETFESVMTIDTAAQKELLHVGDEVERVWAAWALGLRLGDRIIPELLASLETSPVPGTRRHLLVVLAGLGERKALERSAVRDPAPLVRETACRYLARTAQAGDHRVEQILLDRLRSDASAEVRSAILEETDRGKRTGRKPAPD